METESLPAACPRSVEPEAVEGWVLDGEPHPEVDLAAHVPGCPACQAVRDGAERTRVLATALDDDAPQAPERVAARALGRVRVESTALLLARTFAGAGARVARALPAYLGADRQGRSGPERDAS